MDLQIIINRIIRLINSETNKDTNKNKSINWRSHSSSSISIRGIIETVNIFISQNIIDAQNKNGE